MEYFIDLDARIDETAYVSSCATVEAFANIKPGVKVQPDAHIGQHVWIGHDSTIGLGSYIDAGVVIGPNVTVSNLTLIMAGATICPDDVSKHSTAAREIGAGASVGPKVLLHNEVELGEGAIVPTQRTITHIGNFGKKNRVITIYGSTDGPLFSLGCHVGRSFEEIKTAVTDNEHSTDESAATYVPYLPIFNEIGKAVQEAYAKETNLINEMLHIRAERQMGYTGGIELKPKED